MSNHFSIQDLLSHRGFLERLARGLVFDPASSEDVVQQAWLRAIEAPPRRGGHARGWLATVARNIVADGRRAEERRARREHGRARSEEVPSALDVVTRKRRLRLVVREVLKLDEPYRSCVIMRFYGDLPPREIARRLDVSVRSVETRLTRALGVLRARLDRDFGDRSSWCLALLPAAVARGGRRTASALAGQIAAAGVAVVVVGAAAWSVWSRSSPPAPKTVVEDRPAERSHVEVEPRIPALPERDTGPGIAPVIDEDEASATVADAPPASPDTPPRASVPDSPVPSERPAAPAAQQITGRVFSKVSGDPVVGIRIHARPGRRLVSIGGRVPAANGDAPPTRRTLGGLMSSFAARTDDSGRFAFGALPIGDYDLELDGHWYAEAAAHVKVEAGRTPAPVEIAALLGGTIRVRPAARPPGEAPWFASAISESGRSIGGRPGRGDETVSLVGVPPGSYRVEIRATRYHGSESVKLLPEETALVVVELRETDGAAPK